MESGSLGWVLGGFLFVFLKSEDLVTQAEELVGW